MTMRLGSGCAALLVSIQLMIAATGADAAPAAPSGLTAAGFSTTRVDLSWSDNSGNETGFQLDRAPNVNGAPGTWARIASPGANVRSYSDTGRAYGTRYWYRVRAVNNGGNSAYSNTASASTLTAVSLRVSGYPAAVTAGTAGQVMVDALDAKGNAAAGYPGVVSFASSDTSASLPANATLATGTATFPVTLRTAGMQSISAQDSANASITGTQSAIAVNPAGAARFNLTFPNSLVVGSPASLGVTAYDAFGNVARGYVGTVSFSSTSASASLPAPYAFVSADAGTRSFTASLNTAGVQAVTAQDTVNASLTATVGAISVSAGNAAWFALAFPAAVVAGNPASLGVTVYDAFGNLATGYQGSVSFSSTSANASLPGPYTFAAEDAGRKSFTAALNTAGSRSVTAVDLQNSALSGTVSGIAVSSAPATRLTVQGYPALITAGTAAALTVSALDAFGNVDSGYAGTVAFRSTDPQGILPPASALSGGSTRFIATLRTAGVQSIAAQDLVAASLTGSQSGINVNAAPAPCVGGIWQNFANKQLVHAGPGLREPPAAVTYGYTMDSATQTVIMPKCPYLLGQLRLPIFLIDWSDFDPLTDAPNPNNPTSVGLPGYVKATPAEVDAYANGPSGAAQYYRDVSGGKADIKFDVFGWIDSSMPGSYLKPRANYITYSTFYSKYQCDYNAGFLDAVRNAVVFHGADLRNYDADRNGVMDGALFLYEGQGDLCNGGNLSYLNNAGVSLGNPPAFFSTDARQLVPSSDPNSSLFANQDTFILYYNNLPERYSGTEFYPLATWVHELGHLLLGYPDYYYSQFNIGSWALSGNHQMIPSHPAAFEKWMFAHWIEPQVLQSSGQYTLAANEISDGSVYDGGTFLYQVFIDGDPRKFITIENRWFDDAGNIGTQWARAYNRESGLQIVEFNLGIDWFSTAPPQLYRNVPARSSPLPDWRSFRPGDSFSKCYQTMCVTIDQIGAPGQQVPFTVTLTPK